MVDPTTHAARRTEASDSRLELASEARFNIFAIRDETGRIADEVWTQADSVIDGYQFKLISNTSVGGLVAEQRFQPTYPSGNPWMEFWVDSERGEAGSETDRVPGEASLEGIHLLYTYQSSVVLSASYDAKGKLQIIQARHERDCMTHYPGSNMVNPFRAYDFPLAINTRRISLPLKDALREGCAHLGKPRFPAGKLLTAFVVEQFMLGSVLDVREFGSDGHELARNALRYSRRPYDAAHAAAQSASR